MIVAKGCDEEMIKDLNNHFMGECTEVGMYLSVSTISLNLEAGALHNGHFSGAASPS